MTKVQKIIEFLKSYNEGQQFEIKYILEKVWEIISEDDN